MRLLCFNEVDLILRRSPTGRANARPMTGSVAVSKDGPQYRFVIPGTSPTCAESHPPYRQINALAKKLALHFWCGVKIRRCVRELASVARRGAFALAGRYRDD